MAQGVSAEFAGVLDGSVLPAAMADGRVIGARVRCYVATFDLALAAVAKADGDTNVCFRFPKGARPMFGYLLSSATMGAAATIAVGKAGAAGKYRAAAVHTAANAPQLFMVSAAAAAAPLAEYEDVLITIGGAALPGAGTLQVFMFASAR
ncbi:MAG TPA: hypothetical protein VGW34_03845 [Allosphingosinicella sp.]|nr:hypothetical protein [Allosphingosinicella sp.]